MESFILILLVGLPQSGKSTFAPSLAAKLGAAIVCPDNVRLAMHGKSFIDTCEQFVWGTVATMVNALFRSKHRAVIIDACNINKKRRGEWLKFKVEKKFRDITDIHIYEFDVSRDECIRRAKDMDRDDLIPVIERMSENRESVDADEAAEIFHVCGYINNYEIRHIASNGEIVEEEIIKL